MSWAGGGSRGCANRGNNPDGIWLAGATNDVGPIVVNFDSTFGSTLTSLSIDVAGFFSTSLLAWDESNTLIFDQSVALTQGAYTNPGVYSTYVISSTDGISRFEFDGTNAGGNTSIDNLVAQTAAVTSVPEPATLGLTGVGLAGILLGRRRRSR